MNVAGANYRITPATRYIISTSGRPTSLRRYQMLLQERLDLDIAYLPIQPKSEGGKIDPEDFVGAIRGLGALGGAISKDIKGKVVPLLDGLDDIAARTQSVNTVIRKGDQLLGYNTDAMGFEKAILEGIANAGIQVSTAVVYGYGGVFNVAFHVLQKLGIQVFVTGRDEIKVKSLCAALGMDAFPGKADLFVNATPVTDQPLEQATGFLPAVTGAKIVFDHHMPGTQLKAYSEREGKFHIPGTAMYLPQMVAQWSLFLDGIVSAERVTSELMRLADSQ